jgi:hypothetical protein
MIYKRVQTGPKSQFGGVKKGLLRLAYQIDIEDCVTLPAIPPTQRQIIIPVRIASLFLIFIFINQ